MQAIAYSHTGPSSVLERIDRPVPEPKEGEVRVKVVVSAVNPTDWKSRAGTGSKAPAPFASVVPNLDGSGVIDAVGNGVDPARVGERVWLMMTAAWGPEGTAQEFVVVPAWKAVPLPHGASFDLGASLGVPAITAHRALTVSEGGPTRLAPGALAGHTVLVAGGAGAVGHAAIQLAKWAGAAVVTTISSDAKATLAKAAGADHTVNYREGNAADAIRAVAPEGVDTIVEVAPVSNLTLNQSVLKNRGTIAIYANNGGNELSIEVGANMFSNTRFQFLVLYTVGQQYLEEAAQDVVRAVADGALPVGEEAGLPLHRFALAETASAHDAVENDAVGKVLIDVSST